MENNFEKRFIEIRADGSRRITGQAIVFNSESRDMGFIETISPEAVTPELINTSDIVMLYNHNENTGVLARSNKGKGTLRISQDNTGVNFEFFARRTALGDEILSAVQEGDLSACSFAFRVADGGDKWENRNGVYYRTINKIEMLRDFSIVSNPAYEDTSCSVRSFEKFKEEEKLKELKEQEQRDVTVIVVEGEKKEEEPVAEEVPVETDALPEEKKEEAKEEEKEPELTDEEKQKLLEEEEKKKQEMKSFYDKWDDIVNKLK